MRIATLLLALLAPDCLAGQPAPDAQAPFALVLGSTQDGGLPQIGCACPNCVAARRDPSRARLVASLAIVDPRSGQRWLIDATPDLPEQIAMLDRIAPPARPTGGRPPLCQAIALTHGHMGHITSLVQLGREAYAAQGQLVLGSRSMLAALRANAPFRLALDERHLRLSELMPGEPRVLAREADGHPRLTLSALPVPHRNELTDTWPTGWTGPRAACSTCPTSTPGAWTSCLIDPPTTSPIRPSSTPSRCSRVCPPTWRARCASRT